MHSGLFEIHLASDVASLELCKALNEMGYIRDAFIGGTTGVVHPCHFTIDPSSRTHAASLWKRSVDLLSTLPESDFLGYAEAEFTPSACRLPLRWKAFDPLVPFPLERLEYEECPITMHKDFDIHVTANLETIDPRLRDKLEREINFHYVDIRKPAGDLVRVYTFQPLGLKGGRQLFESLAEYFTRAGGLDGKIKLEMCTEFARFPASANCVPPVVRHLSFRSFAASRAAMIS